MASSSTLHSVYVCAVLEEGRLASFRPLRKERPTEIICADWGIMSVMAINKIKTGDVAARVLQRNGNWAYMSR